MMIKFIDKLFILLQFASRFTAMSTAARTSVAPASLHSASALPRRATTGCPSLANTWEDFWLNLDHSLNMCKFYHNEAKSVAGNHWLQMSPSVALLRGQVWSSLGIRCQQQQLVDWTCGNNQIFPATDWASLFCKFPHLLSQDYVVSLYSCFNNNTLGRLWTSSMPYLFPFIVEYRFGFKIA